MSRRSGTGRTSRSQRLLGDDLPVSNHGLDFSFTPARHMTHTWWLVGTAAPLHVEVLTRIKRERSTRLLTGVPTPHADVCHEAQRVDHERGVLPTQRPASSDSGPQMHARVEGMNSKFRQKRLSLSSTLQIVTKQAY